MHSLITSVFFCIIFLVVREIQCISWLQKHHHRSWSFNFPQNGFHISRIICLWYYRNPHLQWRKGSFTLNENVNVNESYLTFDTNLFTLFSSHAIYYCFRFNVPPKWMRVEYLLHLVFTFNAIAKIGPKTHSLVRRTATRIVWTRKRKHIGRRILWMRNFWVLENGILST